MPEDQIRVAILGCGFYAQNHLNAWRDLAGEGVVLAAVCDMDPEKARAAGEEFGAYWYTDATEMIEVVKPDLIDIVTQPETHRALVELTLSHEIPTIVQKPLAFDWDDCCAIGDAVTRSGVFFGVHENFRFQGPMMRVKQLIDTGEIGTPSFARIYFRTAFDVFFAQPYLAEQKRLAIQDVGVHVLDLARYFVGEVKHLSCETQQRIDNIAGEDTATMLLRHTSGAVSVVEISFSAKRSPDVFPETLLEIEGDKGCIRLDANSQINVASGGESRNEDASVPLLSWTDKPWHVTQASVLDLNRHMIQRFRAQKLPDTNIADNLKTIALVEAAYTAAKTGRAVAPKVWTPGKTP